MATVKSLSRQAQEFLENPRFHQTITIPAAIDHDQLTISYADYGHETGDDSQADSSFLDDEEIPVVLFMPGMYASRYLGHFMHFFAKKHRVRLVALDRFGFGQTPEVAVEKRVQTWVSVLPKFLQALGIKHVALVSHSSGTIYSMNTLWHCRQLLHPRHPQAVFFAPWVDSTHSDAPLVMAARVLPGSAINSWSKFSNFVATHASGPIGASSGLLSKLTTSLGSTQASDLAQDSPLRILELEYGLKISLQEEISALAARKMLSEQTVGAGSETTLCLKKGPIGSWGDAEDMETLVAKIASRERASRPAGQEKLDIQIIFPESDFLTGSAGQKFFESCWVRPNGKYDDCFNVSTKVVPGAGHDDVSLKIAVLKQVFETISSKHTEQ